jgi:hypothetical protein
MYINIEGEALQRYNRTGRVTGDGKAVNEFLKTNSGTQVNMKRKTRIPSAIGGAYSGIRA